MIKVRDLSCGARLVMEEIPYVKSVAIGIWVKAGAVNEQPEISGISHYIEHMLFKGTDSRSAKQIASDADRIAGQINAFTGKEATCYYIKTLSENIDRAADILLDMFINSQFDPAEMDKERMVICEEIKMIEDSPEDDAHDIIGELVFEGSPLAKSIIGTPDTLAGIDRSVIRKYISEQYTADSIVVSVAGNFDEEQLVSIFDGRFDKFAGTKEHPEYGDISYRPHYRCKVKDIEQSHICLGTIGISRDDERFYALSLLNNIMGGSMSSRLFQNIREEKGLAYSVYSIASSFIHTGYYNIYAGVSHDKIHAAIKGIEEELKALKDRGVTAEELEISKAQLKGSYIFGMENVNGRMFNIGRNLTLSGRTDTPEEVIAGIDRVTLQDINEAASLIYDFDNYSAVVISDKETDVERYIRE